MLADFFLGADIFVSRDFCLRWPNYRLGRIDWSMSRANVIRQNFRASFPRNLIWQLRIFYGKAEVCTTVRYVFWLAVVY